MNSPNLDPSASPPQALGGNRGQVGETRRGGCRLRWPPQRAALRPAQQRLQASPQGTARSALALVGSPAPPVRPSIHPSIRPPLPIVPSACPHQALASAGGGGSDRAQDRRAVTGPQPHNNSSSGPFPARHCSDALNRRIDRILTAVPRDVYRNTSILQTRTPRHREVPMKLAQGHTAKQRVQGKRLWGRPQPPCS